jgi:hypothetical protein
MKEAMAMLGHPAGPVRPPLGNLTDQDRADLRAIIDSLDIPTAADRASNHPTRHTRKGRQGPGAAQLRRPAAMR